MIDLSTDFFGIARRQGASRYMAASFDDYARSMIRAGRKPISCKRYLAAVDSGQHPEFW